MPFISRRIPKHGVHLSPMGIKSLRMVSLFGEGARAALPVRIEPHLVCPFYYGLGWSRKFENYPSETPTNGGPLIPLLGG